MLCETQLRYSSVQYDTYSITLCCVHANRAVPEEVSQDDSTHGYIQTARDYVSSSMLDGADVDDYYSYSPCSRAGAQGLGHGIARAHMVAHVLDDDAPYSHVSSVRQGSDETRGPGPEQAVGMEPADERENTLIRGGIPGTEAAVGMEPADAFCALGPNFEIDGGGYGCGGAEYTEVKLKDREREIKEVLLMQGMRAMGEMGFPLLSSSGEERAHNNQTSTKLISSSTHASRRYAADLKAQHEDERTAASARGDENCDDDDNLFSFQNQTLASGQVQAAAASAASVVTEAGCVAAKRKAIPSAEPPARARNSEKSSAECLKSPLHSDFIY